MKSLIALCAAALVSGCAFTRPHVVETTVTATNGVITSTRHIWLTTYAIWPGTQLVGKLHGSAGKTLNAGLSEITQETGGTNVVEALKAIDSIVGKIHP